VNRNFRLKQSTDFKRVRRSGKSYAHPFVVLVVLPAQGERTLCGVTAGSTLGGAVQRNRAKRLIREAIRPLLPKIQPGWKLVLIARKPIIAANLSDIQTSLQELFARAHVLNDSNE
jgi:ribonuclease P protein component